MAASPCLKAFMLPGGPLLPFNPAISFCPRCRDSFSATGFIIAKWWQSEKILLCSLALRRATGFQILVLSGFVLRYRSLSGIVTPTIEALGVPISASARGAPCATTTAQTTERDLEENSFQASPRSVG